MAFRQQVALLAAAVCVALSLLPAGADGALVTDLKGLVSKLGDGTTTVIELGSNIKVDSEVTVTGRTTPVKVTSKAGGRYELVGVGRRMFTISKSTVSFVNVVIKNGGNSAISVAGASELLVDSCTLLNNRNCLGGTNNRCNGGAINCLNSKLTIKGSKMNDNAVTDFGGGIYTQASLQRAPCSGSGLASAGLVGLRPCRARRGAGCCGQHKACSANA